MKSLLLIAAAFAAGVAGGNLGTVRQAAAAPDGDTINARTLNIVDAKGKVVITLTSAGNGDVHGIWVDGFKPNTVAGIVANRGFDTPYLMAYDYRDIANHTGCQFAVSVSDGKPLMQLASGQKVKIFDPFDTIGPAAK